MTGNRRFGPTPRRHDTEPPTSIASCSRAHAGPPAQNQNPLLPAAKQREAVFEGSNRRRTATSATDHILEADRATANCVAPPASDHRVTDQLCLRRGAEHLHALGPSCLAEFLHELAATPRMRNRMLRMLDLWRSRLTVEIVGAAGADRFPPHLSPLPDEATSVDGEAE